MAQCVRLNFPLLKSCSYTCHFQGISSCVVLSDSWLLTLVSRRRPNKGWTGVAAWWICPCNCHDDLGEALQQQSLALACITQVFWPLFLLPQLWSSERSVPSLTVDFASEFIFAKYSELPSWWCCKPHSLTLLSPIGKSHAGLGI